MSQWSAGLPAVMKRPVSSHVSLAQVPPFAARIRSLAHAEVGRQDKDEETETDKERLDVERGIRAKEEKKGGKKSCRISFLALVRFAFRR